MFNINQAREWAEKYKDIYHFTEPGKSVIDLILSLPDQWVDVEKVREIADDMSNWSIPGMLDTTDSVRLSQMMDGFIDRLNALIAPKLPTLADMTPEERKACQWIQAKTWHEVGIIVWVDEDSETAHLVTRADGVLERKFKDVTPLPGEPKTEWPGSVGTPIISNEEKVAADQAVAKDVCNSESNSSETPKSSIKPEDVPPNEPWLIEVGGQKAIGTRDEDDAVVPWSVAALDGSFVVEYHDSVVTLIHKLVPEPPTLPEGMRLADHKECGRVVVSQRADKDGNYKVFCSISSTVTGDDWWCAHKNELDFLDGNQ